ncbi:MAG: hypothetical protein HY755_09650 [Nitrospirae bacterium]|nr:hypothetical protein [Nitrospirota bacterium]
MVIYKGGMVVEKGLYWNPMDGQRVNVLEDGILPGDENKSYLKTSTVGLLAIAPLFGMMYVMFLPLFGIGVFLISGLVFIIDTLAAVAITGVRVCSRTNSRSVVSNWNPSRAYFSGVRKKEKTGIRHTLSVKEGTTNSLTPREKRDRS